MAKTHSPFFDIFPKIKFDVNRSQYPIYEDVTNIFFRLSVIQSVLNNTASYYVYDIEGNDTPEIVAEKVYGDSGAGWIILYTNQILDPQFDWVLTDDAFKKYIVAKYGSLTAALTTPHHYEKVVERTVNGETSSFVFNIDYGQLTDFPPDVPYETYQTFLGAFTIDTTDFSADSDKITADTTIYNSSFASPTQIQINKTFNTYVVDNQTVDVVEYSRYVTQFDYESELNDAKRQIKVIKSQYYPMIMEEFKKMMGDSPSYLRRVS